MTDMKLRQSIQKLENYIRKNNFRGYDPYDLIESPLFRSLPHKLKFVIQQLGRRSPVNTRPVFWVEKGYNPVTLGLCLQGYSYLYDISGRKDETTRTRVEHLAGELASSRSKGYHGSCWGYDFHWAARYATIKAYSPNIVATGIITNALYQSHKIRASEIVKKMIVEAAGFVEKDLNRTVWENTVCFSYSPADHQKVFNASMKAVRLLSQIYALTGEPHYKKLAEQGTAFVIAHQNKDGSWAYALGDARTWVDNYHTGYILDCLDEYRCLTGNTDVDEHLEKGVNFYYNTFFEDNVIPRFRSDRTYPVDSSGVAQSILTLSRFGFLDRAGDVAEYAINEMQSGEGYFYFRKYRYFKNRISYMRWSNAWMFAALTYLLWRKKNAREK